MTGNVALSWLNFMFYFPPFIFFFFFSFTHNSGVDWATVYERECDMIDIKPFADANQLTYVVGRWR